MTTPLPTVSAAFERASALVARRLAATPDDANLRHLQAELAEEWTRAESRGAADADWVRRTVRWVAEWSPTDDLTLLAALGAIARARDGV